jgi:hypothetical protein
MLKRKIILIAVSILISIFGILLTNSFSIVGTIMGVKYATENNGNNK